MITTNIDLGQIIISTCLVIIGFFLKRELSRISEKIELHDREIRDLARTVFQLVGASANWTFNERRMRDVGHEPDRRKQDG